MDLALVSADAVATSPQPAMDFGPGGASNRSKEATSTGGSEIRKSEVFTEKLGNYRALVAYRS